MKPPPGPDSNLAQVPVRRFRLRTKILTGTLGIVLSSLFLIVTYFLYFYHQETRSTLRESLRVGKQTYQKVSDLQVSRMESVLSSIRHSPRFISAISVAMNDLATLKDTARTEYRLSGADLFLIADSEGVPLVGLSSDVKGFLTWSANEKSRISSQNYIQVHVDEDLYEQLGLNWGDEEIYEDMAIYRGLLYKVISAPLYDRENYFLGVILLGSRVNRSMVEELSKVTGADIGFLSKDGVFATSLSKFDSEHLKSFNRTHDLDIFELIGRICARYPINDTAGKTLGHLVVMKSLRSFYEKRKKLFLVSAMVVSIVVLLAILISLLTSRSIVKPLQVISSAFHQVGEGNLETRVGIDSGDELESLSETFNEMVYGLRQKETMSKFLTGMEMEEVDAISAGTKGMSMFGEKRLVSVLFSDIRSFTTICEENDARVIINSLNYYFDMLIPLIEENGGVLDKLIGDCIMAIFEDKEGGCGADNAVRASIAMQAKLSHIRPKMEGFQMPAFYAGFGVNTGECVVGNVGTSDQLSRTVLGDGVNLAARVESLSKEGKETNILFTQSTKDAMKLKLGHDFLMETVVKGKSVPVSIYEVSGVELQAALEELEKMES